MIYEYDNRSSYHLDASLSMHKFDPFRNDSNSSQDFTQHEESNLLEIHEDHYDYPEQFKSFLGNETPRVLFCIGNYSLLKNQIIMICGARNASENGRELAYKCGRLIAEQGYTVASGYARGVDMAAHLGALEAGGSTIAILPYGLLKFKVNRAIREAFECEQFLFEQFLAVSELPPSCPFTGRNALRRNKLLVALSGAVIVIESGETGGTWFSAKYASTKDKPLYFFEGLRQDVIPKLESIGGKRLKIKKGAPDLRKIYRRLREE